MYHKKSNCDGSITVHDFNDATTRSFDVFADLGTCTLTPKAIVKGDTFVYIAYEKEINAETNEFWVRAIDISSTEITTEDIALKYTPEGLAFSNDRLFILGLDEEITDEHKLTVLD